MNLTKPDRAACSENDEIEHPADADAARRFGFEPAHITAARTDLGTFLFAFRENALSDFEEAAQDLNRLAAKLSKRRDELELLAEKTNSYELNRAAGDLIRIIGRLSGVQKRLPGRPPRIQNIAVLYLMAFWVHVDRREDYEGTREVVVSFNGDVPSHPSMKFIIEILDRTNDDLLKNIGRSTIRRVWKKFGPDVPPPAKVHAFEGSIEFII